MDKRQLAQYRMAGLVDQLLNERAADLAASPAAVAEAAEVRAAYAAVAAATGQTLAATQDITDDADAQREQLERLLPALTGPLQAHARATHDAELLAVATLRVRQLRKLRPAQFRDLLTVLLKHATTHQQALERYGFGAAVRQRFDEAAAAFAATVGSTQALLDKTQNRSASAEELLRALMQQLYELDQPMEIFRVLNPELHRAYRIARRVGNPGSRKSDDEDGPAGDQPGK